MRLPSREQAYVPASKLRDYLLSRSHPIGHSKARWLRALGFDESTVGTLEQELIRIAHDEEVSDTVLSAHGDRHVVEGGLRTPTGEVVWIRTVWIIETGEHRPRFVTAYPAVRGQSE